jgi:hypothetical protein
MAQQNNRSPYSVFGVGVMHYDGFSDNVANGRNGVSYRFESNYSFTNPASLSALKHSAFNVGTYIDQGRMRTNTASQKFTNAGFNYISLGVPLLKLKGGAAFGLLPYSDIGYNITNVKDSANISVRNEFEGSGGLSRFNLGFGSNILKNISLGFNYSYIFGQVAEIQRRRYPGSRFMTSYSDENSIYLKGHHLDLGIQFHTFSDSGISHTLGIVLSNNTSLKGELNRTVTSYTEYFTGTEILWDTILSYQERKATVKLPSALHFSYTIGNHEKWQASVGFVNTQWSKYRSIYNDNSGFSNDQKYTLGFFICPKPVFDKTVKNNKVKNYLKSIRYSAGAHYSTGYINAFDTKIAESGITAGIGLPFTKVHKKPDGTRVIITSRIFLTGEYIQRGTRSNNLIQEDFFRFTLGLNFSDSWFNKRKFN